MAITDTRDEIYWKPRDIAQRYQLDPSAPIRWARKGVVLPDGTRLILQHVCTPGGYRFKPAWVDAFLERIAADRANKPDAAPKEPRRSDRVSKMCAELTRQGFQLTT